ncbi:copper resistance protein B [Metapseudomonas furukawaii]|uniref:Copper resistance protein B n=1 Tax=Metapseudomonas furukawaii TaxID=1149133 RepID=L8MCZ0_METFU|nr:copper resistance protein B [Pseudomonas furukawaii]ELS25401.1 Copper resistance protein B [Pseudomonas furukawaii]ELS29167.1 Copper resistance protein B [Pseudomonas furukawaii]BAU73945.1 copper resistance protein B [Pseudomonas furukawaii]
MITRISVPSALALVVSFSALHAGSASAAGEMDHSQMNHGQMQGMDHGQMDHGQMQGMDHGQMQGMDHGKMDHSQMQGMDHSQMNHGQMQDMDHGQMNHGQMQGMDHGQMNHGQMQGMDHGQMNQGSAEAAPAATSRTPIPVLTDADREAAFPPLPGHGIHDSKVNTFFLLDQLEYQDADEGSVLSWDASGWIGGDIDRLWLRSEGERTNGVTEEAEVQALWGHSIGPWWDVVTGVRQDFKPGSPQTWGAFGLQGMALYAFEAEATAFVGENGQTAARLEGDYDILLTNRLILQPTAEANFYGKNDHERGVGSGLANTEVGLRLRYEILREFAPYIGVTWSRSYGNTADMLREDGEDVEEARFVAGIRMWF